MKYIYDLLLNFQDSERVFEFFEWSDEDSLEQVKRVPLFRISSFDMNSFLSSKVKVDSNFIKQIYKKSFFYNKKKFTGCLFCDLKRVVAIEFAHDGNVLARSSLLIDEEYDVIVCARKLKLFKVCYQVLENNSLSFYTRKEEECRKYLLSEIKFLYDEKNVLKFNYLYEELFGIENNTFSERYKKMLDKITLSFDSSCFNLYDIVKLSYKKNR